MSRKEVKENPPPKSGKATRLAPHKRDASPAASLNVEAGDGGQSEEDFVSDEPDFSQRPAEAEPAHYPPGDEDDSDDERDDENYAVRRGR